MTSLVASLREIAERYSFRRAPIILGGCGRSGTTLLLAILGSHPRIHAIPDETHAFCPSAYGPEVNGRIVVDGARGVERDRLHARRIAGLEPDAAFSVARLRNALSRSPPLESCERWCEKTPKNVLFFRRILDEIREVRLIHLVRDGRDVVTSVHPDRDGKFHVPIARWIMEVEAGLMVADDDRVLTVRYEDLVRDYEACIRRVCQFLDEPFDAKLLAWHLHTNIQQHDSWEGLRVRELYDSAIGRWRHQKYDQVVAELMADPRAEALLARLGYFDER